MHLLFVGNHVENHGPASRKLNLPASVSSLEQIERGTSSLLSVQCSCSGWPTGNGKKLSNSQACCLAQLCLAAAYFLSISCGPSTPSAMYRHYLMASPNFCSWPSVAKMNVLPSKSVFLRASTLHDTSLALRLCSLSRGT